MKRYAVLTFALLSVIADTLAKTPQSARIIEAGLIECFEEGLKNEAGKTCWASPSAIEVVNGKLVLASDKSVPGEHRSPVFSLKYKKGVRLDGCELCAHTDRIFQDTMKYESMALSEDGKHVVFSTPFGSLGDDPMFDGRYNQLLVADVNNVERPYKAVSDFEGKSEGFGWLRVALHKLIKTPEYPKGVNYTNVEGITFGPDSRLYIGIRAYGQDYDNNTCTMAIASIEYEWVKGNLKLKGMPRLEYWIDTKELALSEKQVGLSEIHYNWQERRFYILASYESNQAVSYEDIGTFLLTLDFKQMKAGELPHPILNERNKPIEFSHKMEGLAFLDKSTIVVIADDDYIEGKNRHYSYVRKPNQAGYAIVKLL